MANITVNNLVDLQGTPVEGQRVIQIAPGVWLPIGLGGTFAPASSSDSSFQLLSIEAGYIDENGNFQPLSFEGTLASNSGSAVEGLQHKIFNTGHEEPDYPSSGDTATDFYKCSYVNSDSWGGYKAVLTDGFYRFESTLTSNLTYSVVTPEVGKVYADGALVRAFLYDGIPSDGLVFYAPLSTSANAAETGQSLIYAGNYSFSTYQGIQAMNLQGGCVSVSTVAQSGLDNGFALSMWICNADWTDTSIVAGMGSWDDSSQQQWWGLQSYNGASSFCYRPGINVGSRTNLEADTWYHVVYQISNGFAKAWVNGAEDLNAALEFSAVECSGKPLYLGSLYGNPSSYPLNGYIAALRLYNRVLSSAEITALSREFTPTQS